MSDATQDGPIMDGAEDATKDEQLSGLIEQVVNDHEDEGASGMADRLRDRLPATESAPEDPGDTVE
jgi:hypothetical protein